jgi:hypothetical protein
LYTRFSKDSRKTRFRHGRVPGIPEKRWAETENAKGDTDSHRRRRIRRKKKKKDSPEEEEEEEGRGVAAATAYRECTRIGRMNANAATMI